MTKKKKMNRLIALALAMVMFVCLLPAKSAWAFNPENYRAQITKISVGTPLTDTDTGKKYLPVTVYFTANDDLGDASVEFLEGYLKAKLANGNTAEGIVGTGMTLVGMGALKPDAFPPFPDDNNKYSWSWSEGTGTGVLKYNIPLLDSDETQTVETSLATGQEEVNGVMIGDQIGFRIETVMNVPSSVLPEGGLFSDEFRFTVEDAGNYPKEITTSEDEGPVSLENAVISDINDILYTGVEAKPSPTVTLDGKALTPGTDYELSYTNNISVGTATVTATGIGDYTDSVSKDFRIVAASLESSAVGIWFQGGEAVKYTGNPLTPTVQIKNWNTSTSYVENRDFTVSYTNNTEIGTAYATVTGTGNLTGEKELEFYIVDPCEWAIPTGLTVTVDTIPQDGSGALTQDSAKVTVAFTVDPDVKYVDFYAWGVSADGSMEGELIGPYTTGAPDPEESEPQSWSWKPVEGQENRYTYELFLPTLASEDEQQVKQSDGYSYMNGVKENDLVTITATGNAEVTVGSGESSHTKWIETDPSAGVTFAITPASEGQTFEAVTTGISLEEAEMATIAGQAYTGKAIKPAVTITYGEATLTEDTDYELTYTNNKEVGIATVTATGKGAYTGTLTGEFVIYGWKTVDGSYSYLNPNGKWATGWNKINKKWYYFDKDCVMLTDFQQIGKNWYYFGTDGVMCTGWQQIDKNWYYFGTDGVMVDGWQQIGKNKFYFFSGVMCTGWQQIDGSWYYFKNGAMLTGWQQIGKNWYYLGTNGVMVNGWQKIGKKWYYFKSGAMLTDWQKIGKNWYYLGTDGAMVTGWQQTGKKWYYLGTDGAMLAGWQQIGKNWYYLGTDGAMVTGWKLIGKKWYYFETSGIMVTGTRKIGKKTYQFNAAGECLNP